MRKHTKLDDPHQINLQTLQALVHNGHSDEVFYIYMPVMSLEGPRIAKLRYLGRDIRDFKYIFTLVHGDDEFDASTVTLDIREHGRVHFDNFEKFETRLFDNYWLAYGWMLRHVVRKPG